MKGSTVFEIIHAKEGGAFRLLLLLLQNKYLRILQMLTTGCRNKPGGGKTFECKDCVKPFFPDE